MLLDMACAIDLGDRPNWVRMDRGWRVPWLGGLAQEGADIIAVDICRKFEASPAPGATPEDLDVTAGMVKDAGGRVVTAEVDVREFAALPAAVDSGVALRVDAGSCLK